MEESVIAKDLGSAEEMERRYPRQDGIRCDEEAVRKHFIFGDEPTEVPFGTAPKDFESDALGFSKYESEAEAGQLVSD